MAEQLSKGPFDVIVVGAGSAGCVVTRRLVDRGAEVLLLEAGGEATNPAIDDPLRFGELWFGEQDWAYRTTPQEHAAGRRLHWPRGRVLGGSSALNAMIYARGAALDYDHWAYLGNDGWSWQDVLPAFRAIEDYDTGADETHGSGGPLPVLTKYDADPVHEALIQAAGETGIPHQTDYNSGHPEGISKIQFTIADGRRCSAAAAYLDPVAQSPGLTVVTGARVRRVLLEGTRCVGVEWLREGIVERATARAEVVISAGAIESPRLLMLSGIGAAAELRSVGIDAVAHLPGVGRNLHDHVLAPVIFSTERPVGRPSPGLGPAQTHLFWRSRPGLPVPDLQPLHFPAPMYQPGMTGPGSGFTLQAGIVRPASRGSVRLTGAQPEDELLLDPGTLRTAADLDSLAAAAVLCRDIGRSSVLREEWGARELYPGPEAGEDAGDPALRDYLRRTVTTYHHQSGTCKMGVDADAVVDPRLRVYGIEGLRVADASVFPAITTGNTHAPALMVGEQVSSFIAADHGTA
ncbi:GMC family oxidoreductase N-terminal domain-containing protein [Streptomyces sp. ISL-96]|uniref:GMC family oxidoreductase n=1 Tax=Streptomyces sp. ISL-96 TaxID=2819191 RepID=UPI001BEAD60A|nr:GMC family oxidoreductase N-terminal domain-containing protein [Streptomyces sp. ISL-96]MBT2488430.1 GMC family oxidoreductase N-terminal domain-containing protein [Streptomyces sp. ISL-96]